MKVQKDTFLIQVDGDRNANIDVTGANGEKLIIDHDYNKYKHTTQIGKIFALPILITKQYLNDIQLNVGDTVVFHHFVCQPDHKVNIGENVYRAEYFHLYAKVQDGLLFPLEDVVFVIPIMEDESALYAGNIRIKTFCETVKQQGVVLACSKQAILLGIQPNDKILFTANADYKMKIADKELYRMRIRNITGIERDGELICLDGKILVKQFVGDQMVGNFREVRPTSEVQGSVVKMGARVEGLEIGSMISYFNGTLGTLEHAGQTYAMIEPRNINYVI